VEAPALDRRATRAHGGDLIYDRDETGGAFELICRALHLLVDEGEHALPRVWRASATPLLPVEEAVRALAGGTSCADAGLGEGQPNAALSSAVMFWSAPA
jgi:hypothetical protein